MVKQLIEDLIKQYSIPIKEVLIESKLVGRIDELINGLGFNDINILLVSDQNLKHILVDVSKNVKSNKVAKLVLNYPKADDENIDLILSKCQNINLILAIGSGTINDLCKIASFKKNIPYVVIASAPSMNGYASANASILSKGHKKSFIARQAQAIYFDLDVISKAPKNLIKAGIGDSLCYYSCHFDWLLSHLVAGTDFNVKVFEILKPLQEKLINFRGDITDRDFIELLCKILTVSGFTMYLCKGSYPASQGEHLIAHFLEMKYPEILKNYFHGEQIAITTLTMIGIQESFLKLRRLELKNNKVDLEYLKNLFNGDVHIANECLEEMKKKAFLKINLKKVNEDLDIIKKKLAKTTISKKKMLEIYDRFNLLQSNQDLKIANIFYKEAINNSHLIRNRLTTLDFKI